MAKSENTSREERTSLIEKNLGPSLRNNNDYDEGYEDKYISDRMNIFKISLYHLFLCFFLLFF